MNLISEISVTVTQQVGDDTAIAAAAKVSTIGAEAIFEYQSNEDLSVEVKRIKGRRGLLNYLMQHRHGTPFEHGFITFLVHAPIVVWREWHRHRIGFSYNEESGRYKTLEPTFYIPPRDRAMMKVDDWKPGRPKFLPCESDEVYDRLINNLKRAYELSYEMYLDNLNLGIDPGLARDCLNVGIYSSCWVSANPRSLMAFLSLRTHEETALKVSYPLYEIEVAARKVEELLQKYWPLTHEVFNKHGRLGA